MLKPKCFNVSIHALTRRATAVSGRLMIKLGFQSTPSRGGRHPLRQRKHCKQDVSIHALTRRATNGGGFLVAQCRCFNPRPHAEGDFPWLKNLIGETSFNPRPHAEGDPTNVTSKSKESTFQSTPSRGGRLMGLFRYPIKTNVSIHALTRRATFLTTSQSSPFFVSIHALTRRATLTATALTTT